jgi:hypothetical protein
VLRNVQARFPGINSALAIIMVDHLLDRS